MRISIRRAMEMRNENIHTGIFVIMMAMVALLLAAAAGPVAAAAKPHIFLLYVDGAPRRLAAF